MADYTVIPATFELRHYPDAYTETELRDGASWELGAGMYKIVAVVDGAELVVQSYKGGGVQKKLAAAKRARESSTASSAATATSTSGDTTTQE